MPRNARWPMLHEMFLLPNSISDPVQPSRRSRSWIQAPTSPPIRQRGRAPAIAPHNALPRRLPGSSSHHLPPRQPHHQSSLQTSASGTPQTRHALNTAPPSRRLHDHRPPPGQHLAGTLDQARQRNRPRGREHRRPARQRRRRQELPRPERLLGPRSAGGPAGCDAASRVRR